MRWLKRGCAVVAALALLCAIGFSIFVGLCARYSVSHVGVETDYSKSAVFAEGVRSLASPAKLTIVTFNVQALWVVGWNRPARMRALAEKLEEIDPDICGFQEVFVQSDRETLIAGLEEHTRLRHFQYYSSGLVGSGLLVASAYPIQEIFFHRYSAGGDWYKLWEGDWWAGKGVALARIALPDNGGLFDFYVTHAQAHYPWSNYGAVQEQQMQELVEFLNATHAPNTPGFLVGDMNSGPGAKPYEIAVSGAALERVMAVKSHIDHIFALKRSPCDYAVEGSVELERHNDIRLSDHRGYVSTIRIEPNRSDS